MKTIRNPTEATYLDGHEGARVLVIRDLAPDEADIPMLRVRRLDNGAYLDVFEDELVDNESA